MGNNASHKKKKTSDFRSIRFCLNVVSVMVFFIICATAGAVEINTGSEDWKMNLDTTVRYTLDLRVQEPSNTILKSLNFDDGDRNFEKNKIFMNRVDLLPELRLVYKEHYGVQVSGAAWFDERWTRDMDNKSPSTSNYVDEFGNHGLGLTSDTKRQQRQNVELLNAYAFGTFNLGEWMWNVRVGRSVVYWGAGLLNAMHAISYAQMPMDFSKAVPQPGVEIKEVFRPLNNVYVSVQPTETLVLGAQYFLDWEENRLSETGAYFSAFDFALRGGQSLFLAPGVSIPQGGIIEPHKQKDWGVMAKWSPEFLNGATMGFYYRNFSDKLPQAGLLLSPMSYWWSYPGDINLYGISYTKTLFGTAFGAEISYRTNMPLASGMGIAATTANLPKEGEGFGARGNTFHALANDVMFVNFAPLWDSSVLILEVDYSYIEKATKNEALYLGDDSYSDSHVDKPTKDYLEATINFTPTWYQVFTGVDLTIPLSFSMGLMGTSGVSNGGNKDAGSYSVGVGFDFFNKYKLDLKYTAFFGDVEEDASGGIATSTGFGYLKDRGFLSLTLKASF